MLYPLNFSEVRCVVSTILSACYNSCDKIALDALLFYLLYRYSYGMELGLVFGSVTVIGDLKLAQPTLTYPTVVLQPS